MTRALAVVALASAFGVGCASPEATRTRGGGPGGDPGNRPATVEMHEGSLPYWKTPHRNPAAHPPLDAAAHARQLNVQ